MQGEPASNSTRNKTYSQRGINDMNRTQIAISHRQKSGRYLNKGKVNSNTNTTIDQPNEISKNVIAAYVGKEHDMVS